MTLFMPDGRSVSTLLVGLVYGEGTCIKLCPTLTLALLTLGCDPWYPVNW